VESASSEIPPESPTSSLLPSESASSEIPRKSPTSSPVSSVKVPPASTHAIIAIPPAATRDPALAGDDGHPNAGVVNSLGIVPVAGIALGVIVLLAVLALIIWRVKRERRSIDDAITSEPQELDFPVERYWEAESQVCITEGGPSESDLTFSAQPITDDTDW
jgi:hypothetical protein